MTGADCYLPPLGWEDYIKPMTPEQKAEVKALVHQLVIRERNILAHKKV